MVSYALADSINSAVNSSTKYRTDIDLYGVDEFWVTASGMGDCEDSALAKRKALLDAGASIDDLRLATCWIETGEYHAVLVVSTDEGEYVLDNRYAHPMPRQALPYRWDKIQQGNQWVNIV